MIQNELTHVGEVAKHPLALVAYVVVVAFWCLRAWLMSRPQRAAERILAQYQSDTDRLTALKELMGEQPPPGLRRQDLLAWVRLRSAERSRYLLLIAYVSTLLTIILVVGTAIIQPSDPAPRIIDQGVSYDTAR